MTTDKLARAIKKELTRNPKKTVALALVTLVALWFWAPLAWKWCGGDAGKKARKAELAAAREAKSAPSAANKPAVTDAPTAAPLVKVDWDKMLARMAQDPQMQTATLANPGRDPFVATRVEQQAVAEANTQEDGNDQTANKATAKATGTPADYGLLLQGTLITSKQPKATINGKTYGIGDVVTMKPGSDGAGGSSRGVSFELIEIAPRRIVLRHENQTYEVKLNTSSLAEGDVLTFGSQASSR